MEPQQRALEIEALHAEASALLQAGDHAAAEALLRQALPEDGRGAPSLLLLLGRALHHLSRHAEAAAVYAEAARHEGTRARALSGQALAWLNLRQLPEALAACHEALELHPDLAEAHKNLALLLMRQGRVNEARAAAARALELHPDYPEGHLAMGLVRMLQMHAPDAERHFRAALAVDPRCAGAHANLGFMYRRMNHLEEAAEELRQAVALRPRDDVSLNNLALCLADLNLFAEAEAVLLRVLELQPENPDYLLNLGALYRNLDRKEEAVALNRRVLATSPGHRQALTNLPALLLESGRPEDAADAAQEAVRAFPDHPAGHYNLAVTLLHLRRAAEAEEAAQQALELGLDSPALHLCLAQARLMQGHHAAALESATRAQTLREDARSHFTMAQALQGLERKDEATLHFRRSLELDPEDSQGAAMFLAGLAASGEAAPQAVSQAYVRRLFNQYAGTYDAHLQQRLEYHGPELLARALAPLVETLPGRRFLDLGCGTGLCAPWLRPWAEELVGVDLAENMVHKARQLGLYHYLVTAEACAFLEAETRPFHCIVAADVLVYVGALTRLLQAAAAIMPPQGVFAFTTELHRGEGYCLGHKGRYSHSPAYVREQAAQAGFTVRSLEEAELRKEAGATVAGLVVLLRRV